jgi:hypothetical protein
MANYQKTQELFNGEPNREPGLKYEKSGEQLAEEKWFAQVKNPNTGEFFQLEDLRPLGAVPSDFRKDEKPIKYPFNKVDTIIRIKKADGSEWLKSRQTWIGLDRLGNDVTKTFVDPELYDRPVFAYQSKPVNPKDVFSKTERKAVSVTYEQEPTLRFTSENLEQLYLTCSNPADRKTIFLVIKNEGTDQSPRHITNHEDFKNKPFDDLWEWAITPRFSLDRSFKDNLEGSHIG